MKWELLSNTNLWYQSSTSSFSSLDLRSCVSFSFSFSSYLRPVTSDSSLEVSERDESSWDWRKHFWAWNKTNLKQTLKAFNSQLTSRYIFSCLVASSLCLSSGTVTLHSYHQRLRIIILLSRTHLTWTQGTPVVLIHTTHSTVPPDHKTQLSLCRQMYYHLLFFKIKMIPDSWVLWSKSVEWRWFIITHLDHWSPQTGADTDHWTHETMLEWSGGTLQTPTIIINIVIIIIRNSLITTIWISSRHHKNVFFCFTCQHSHDEKQVPHRSQQLLCFFFKRIHDLISEQLMLMKADDDWDDINETKHLSIKYLVCTVEHPVDFQPFRQSVPVNVNHWSRITTLILGLWNTWEISCLTDSVSLSPLITWYCFGKLDDGVHWLHW